MTARLMVDSTTPGDMPRWADIQCFYIDGQFAASQAQIDAWRGPKVLINVTGDPAHGGDCLDVESGDATPADIPAWYDHQHTLGTRYLTIYSDRNQFAECTNALAGRAAHRWLATLAGPIITIFDGHPITACQAFGSALTGAHYDLSVAFDQAWHPNGSLQLTGAELAHLENLAGSVAADVAALQRALKTL